MIVPVSIGVRASWTFGKAVKVGMMLIIPGKILGIVRMKRIITGRLEDEQGSFTEAGSV